LAVGTETEVALYDVRTQQVVLQYEPHLDEVTQLAFHPLQPSLLFTGSIDGLCCVLDPTKGANEDDATVAVFNVDQPISRLDFFGPNRELLAIGTTVETFSLWNISTQDRLAQYEEAKSMLSEATGTQADYIVGMHYDHAANRLLAVSGSFQGAIGVAGVADDGTLQQAGALSGAGHVDTVRCLFWDEQSRYIITGGEDSRLCCWARGDLAKETTVVAPQQQLPGSGGKATKEKVRGFTPY